MRGNEKHTSRQYRLCSGQSGGQSRRKMSPPLLFSSIAFQPPHRSHFCRRTPLSCGPWLLSSNKRMVLLVDNAIMGSPESKECQGTHSSSQSKNCFFVPFLTPRPQVQQRPIESHARQHVRFLLDAMTATEFVEQGTELKTTATTATSTTTSFCPSAFRRGGSTGRQATCGCPSYLLPGENGGR